jgi:hypothetical protein
MLLREEAQQHLTPAISRVLPVTKIEPAACYADGEFPRVPGSIPVDDVEEITLADHLQWMLANHEAMQVLCGALTTHVMWQKGKIVIDRYGFFVLDIIRQLFPKAEVSLLPQTDDFMEIVEEIAMSHVFIVCHISSIVLAAFARCSVVEIQPIGCECMKFGEMWAHVGGAVYLPFMKCHSTKRNHACYLDWPSKWSKVDPTELRDVILSALQMRQDNGRMR